MKTSVVRGLKPGDAFDKGYKLYNLYQKQHKG